MQAQVKVIPSFSDLWQWSYCDNLLSFLRLISNWFLSLSLNMFIIYHHMLQVETPVWDIQDEKVGEERQTLTVQGRSQQRETKSWKEGSRFFFWPSPSFLPKQQVGKGTLPPSHKLSLALNCRVLELKSHGVLLLKTYTQLRDLLMSRV